MDEKMEIRLVNPTEDGFLQKIDWNKAELEANVRSIVEAYQGLVYTEDTVSDAKNDRAALRKLLNEIEDRRKPDCRRYMLRQSENWQRYFLLSECLRHSI